MILFPYVFANIEHRWPPCTNYLANLEPNAAGGLEVSISNIENMAGL